MARGHGKEPKEIFHIDRLRFIRRSTDPDKAPETNTCEIYIKHNQLYKMCDNGVAAPINATGVSASPGFTWGRKGVVSATNKVYLLNDEVPSNITGRIVKFTNPVIRAVQVSNGEPSTFTITIQEHDGTTFTSLVSVSLTAQRSKEEDFNIPVTSGKELAVKVTAGSCKNPVVGVILDGLF